MAIDWKTIISEFDGKPTLLQAIGKLRKAVEDETITIQQAQAEIAKLESQQKADEALITTAQSTADEAKINAYNASQKGDQALGKATTADTKAQNAQSAAQAADTKAQAADTKAQNAQSAAAAADTKAQQALDLASIEITLEPSTVTRGTLTDEQLATLLSNDNCYIKHNGIIYTLFKRSDTVLQYTVGYLNDTKNIQNIKVLINSKAWVIENIALPQTKIYKHHIVLTSNGEKGFFDFYSSKNTKCVSLADLKTLLGNTFEVEVCGQYSFRDSGDNDRFYRYAYITETAIFVEKVHTTQGGDLDNNYPTIGTDSNVTWAGITITDTVTAI